MSSQNDKISQFWHTDQDRINLKNTKLFLYENVRLDFHLEDVWKKESPVCQDPTTLDIWETLNSILDLSRPAREGDTVNMKCKENYFLVQNLVKYSFVMG